MRQDKLFKFWTDLKAAIEHGAKERTLLNKVVLVDPDDTWIAPEPDLNYFAASITVRRSFVVDVHEAKPA